MDNILSNLGLDEDSTIQIGDSFIVVSNFKGIFSDVPDNPTYDDFMFIDGGEKGFKPLFDEWKEQGILS